MSGVLAARLKNGRNSSFGQLARNTTMGFNKYGSQPLVRILKVIQCFKSNEASCGRRSIHFFKIRNLESFKTLNQHVTLSSKESNVNYRRVRIGSAAPPVRSI